MNTHVSTDCSNILMCTTDDLPLYTREDLDDALLRISDPIVRDAVYAIWHTGLRLSEYIDMTADMISDTVAMITIPAIFRRTATHDIYLNDHVWMWFHSRAAAARKTGGDKKHPCYIFRGMHKCCHRASMMAYISQAITQAVKRDELPSGTSCAMLRYIYTRRLYDAAGGDLDVVQRQTGYISKKSLILFLIRPYIEAGVTGGC